MGSQKPKHQASAEIKLLFKQLRSSYSDNGAIRAEGVRLCWPQARAVAPLVAHSAHLYLEHREYSPHYVNIEFPVMVKDDVAVWTRLGEGFPQLLHNPFRRGMTG